MSKIREPEHLRRGKEFHKRVQKEWLNNNTTTEEEVVSEKLIIKPSGRKGRVDIFINSDDPLVAIAEIKSSDWDRMTLSAVHRNVRRQTRQVWDYIESQLKLEKDVSPGIIFSQHPKDQDRLILIEKLFEEEGIQVVWKDESIEERKARSQKNFHK